MDTMDFTLIDPFVPPAEKLEHAFLKGYISRDDADRLLRTIEYADAAFDDLVLLHPSKVVAIVEDDAGDFQVMPGDDDLSAESQAIEFFPNVPYVVLSLGFAALPLAGTIVMATGTIRNGHPFVDGSWTDLNKKVTKPKSYLIDTGASESMISLPNIIGAEIKIIGMKRIRTAGGIVSMMKIGGTEMTFPVEPAGGGAKKDVTCELPLLLGSANILGVDQLKKLGIVLIFDPAGGTVKLEEREKKAPKKKGNKKSDK